MRGRRKKRRVAFRFYVLLFVALCVFLFVKFMNRIVPKKAEAPKKLARVCPYCKGEIADDATRCPHCTSQL